MADEAFHKGLEGVIAVQSSICSIDGARGILLYRGYDIRELAEHSTFEEVAYLLLHDKLPQRKELAAFNAALFHGMKIPVPVRRLIMSFPKNIPAMSALRSCVSLLAAYDKDSEDMSLVANQHKAVRLLAVMPALIAAIQRAKEGKNIVAPKKGLSFAGNFLFMLHGKRPSKEHEHIMDVCLILHAEHELNASTFAARVAVSTLADMHSGVVAALSTLKGPLHGGANKSAIQALHYLGDSLHITDACAGSCLKHVDQYVYRLLKEHKRIMGIGHRVYKVKDPRAIILEKYAQRIAKERRDYDIAKEIERVMAEEKKLYPNVDFFSGIVYEGLGIPPDLYVCLFALARTAGWLAHILEQYQDNRLLRPLAQYTGQGARSYVSLSRRA